MIKEVNELLGETPVREASSTDSMAGARKSLLSVDKR